jgi:hypothetical protein
MTAACGPLAQPRHPLGNCRQRVHERDPPIGELAVSRTESVADAGQWIGTLGIDGTLSFSGRAAVVTASGMRSTAQQRRTARRCGASRQRAPERHVVQPSARRRAGAEAQDEAPRRQRASVAAAMAMVAALRFHTPM